MVLRASTFFMILMAYPPRMPLSIQRALQDMMAVQSQIHL